MLGLWAVAVGSWYLISHNLLHTRPPASNTGFIFPLGVLTTVTIALHNAINIAGFFAAMQKHPWFVLVPLYACMHWAFSVEHATGTFWLPYVCLICVLCNKAIQTTKGG